ncbi:MAG: hypothetical protein AB1631_28870 [Acidobacteriota bacterium]
MAKRGIVYLVWGDSIKDALARSIDSVRDLYPDMPIEVFPVDGAVGNLSSSKARMCELTPFDTTLFLDADTVMLGNVDFAFQKAEQFGLACCICEAPWMRRYGDPAEAEMIEYNTGVIFFSKEARLVFDRWASFSRDLPSRSRWRTLEDPLGYVRGLAFDDQAGFARAVAAAELNPFILPINYNLRPYFHRSFFAPVKIWHDYSGVPAVVRDVSQKVERGETPITYIRL